uniref:Uncharacterized protein n=1 Tax=Ditylenchus dipsaci TaxID=166011 RepID=A0A915CNE0_9BILA
MGRVVASENLAGTHDIPGSADSHPLLMGQNPQLLEDVSLSERGGTDEPDDDGARDLAEAAGFEGPPLAELAADLRDYHLLRWLLDLRDYHLLGWLLDLWD